MEKGLTQVRRTLRNPRKTLRNNAKPQRGALRQPSSAAFQALGFLAGSPRPPPALGRAPTWAILAPAFQAEASATPHATRWEIGHSQPGASDARLENGDETVTVAQEFTLGETVTYREVLLPSVDYARHGLPRQRTASYFMSHSWRH